MGGGHPWCRPVLIAPKGNHGENGVWGRVGGVGRVGGRGDGRGAEEGVQASCWNVGHVVGVRTS